MIIARLMVARNIIVFKMYGRLIGFETVYAKVYSIRATCGTKFEETTLIATHINAIAETVAAIACPKTYVT